MEPEYPQQPQYAPQPPMESPIVQQPLYSMKWYKFLIYFALWLSAIAGVGLGISYLTGHGFSFSTEYTKNGETVRQALELEDVLKAAPGLRTASIIAGILTILGGALALLTRFQLASYKKLGPVLLYAVYLLSAVGTLILYLSAASAAPAVYEGIEGVSVAKDSVHTLVTTLRATGWATFVISLVVTFLNFIYFNKRKSLFVN